MIGLRRLPATHDWNIVFTRYFGAMKVAVIVALMGGAALCDAGCLRAQSAAQQAAPSAATGASAASGTSSGATSGTVQEAAKPAEDEAVATERAWAFDLNVSGYYLPEGGSYASPTFTADRDWLHLEARYNYEAQRTASLWFGYNFSVGKKVELDVTPMIGGIFGSLNGIAPGAEVTVAYKKLEFYSANEYIFDTSGKSGDFFYTWTQLTYAPAKWISGGYVVQRTRAYHSNADIQRGLTVEFTRKKASFSTQVFSVTNNPIFVFSVGYSF